MTPLDYRVVASCFEPEAADDMTRRRQALRAHLAALLKTRRPDLIVLPEVVIATGVGLEKRCGAEPVDGPTVAMVSKLAAGFKVNICVPIIEETVGGLYNTAVYVNRTGGVGGVYRKQVPTAGEIRRGIQPGAPAQAPVVVDRLRVGTAICFDENFPDQIWPWIAAGVDLLVFPAYTFAGELMRNWAVNCGVPLVCAFPWESVIYERDGSVLARAGTLTTTVGFGHHPAWIAGTLNFRRRIYHLDENQEQLKKLEARYGSDVDVRLMERDGRMMLTVHGANVTLDRVERDLGLVPLQAYLRASRALAVAGRPRENS